MAEWVLILWLVGPNKSAAVTLSFPTEAACQAVGKAAERKFTSSLRDVTFLCVER